MKGRQFGLWYLTGMLSAWLRRSVCCALLLAAAILERAGAETSSLHLPSSGLLPVRAQSLHLQAGFEEGYPHFDLAHAQGLMRAIELRLHGLFHNAKVSGLGDTYRYDFSELEAGLRFRLTRAGPASLALVPAAGYSRARVRHSYSDGRESAQTNRQAWGEILGGYPLPPSVKFTLAGRGLRDLESDTDTTAVIAALALSPDAKFSLIGDLGFFIDNPNGWRRPWGAGIRVPMERSSLVIYASNTYGTTVAAALAGTDVTFMNLRLVLGI